MAGASCCRCGGRADTSDKLLRCLRCQRLPHTSFCPEMERCDCSDASLLEAKPREEQVPSWVSDFAAVDGAACCKCGAGDTWDQLGRCFSLPVIPASPPFPVLGILAVLSGKFTRSFCTPEIVYNCCDGCLFEAKSLQERVPSWVGDLAAVDFSSPCRKNRFCPTCLIGFSGRHCPSAHRHAGGQEAVAIEILVLDKGGSLQTFVDVKQINGLYDCSEIQLEMEIVPAPRLLRQLLPLHAVKCGAKEYCSSTRVGDKRFYCSMKCKTHWQEQADKDALSYQLVKALLAEDFTSEHQMNAFCLSCRAAFCTVMHSDHADHPSVKIISHDGWLFLRVPATEVAWQLCICSRWRR